MITPYHPSCHTVVSLIFYHMRPFFFRMLRHSVEIKTALPCPPAKQGHHVSHLETLDTSSCGLLSDLDIRNHKLDYFSGQSLYRYLPNLPQSDRIRYHIDFLLLKFRPSLEVGCTFISVHVQL